MRVLPVYLNIARHLKKRTGQDLLICLGTALILCHEADIHPLVATARKELVAIKVHHTKTPCERETAIYYQQDGQPATHTVREDLSWDDLNADVREAFIRSGQNTVTIKLYPEEE